MGIQFRNWYDQYCTTQETFHPVVRINEASAKPNSGFFNTGQAGKGSRTTMFAGAEGQQ